MNPEMSWIGTGISIDKESQFAPCERLVVVDMVEMESNLKTLNAMRAKPFPRVGDTLAIRHQVKRTSAGDVLGIQRADGRHTNAKITAVYLGGSVRCGHSEVWEVRPGTVGHWETINPDRVERS